MCFTLKIRKALKETLKKQRVAYALPILATFLASCQIIDSVPREKAHKKLKNNQQIFMGEKIVKSCLVFFEVLKPYRF